MVKYMLAILLVLVTSSSYAYTCPDRNMTVDDVDIMIEQGVAYSHLRDEGIALDALAGKMALDQECRLIAHRDLLAASLLIAIDVYVGQYKHLNDAVLRSKLHTATSTLRERIRNEGE